MCIIQRVLHQVAHDDGSWRNAALTLPGGDPCFVDALGLEEQELEAVSPYNTAMPDLRKNALGESAVEVGKGGGDQKNQHGGGRKG